MVIFWFWELDYLFFVDLSNVHWMLQLAKIKGFVLTWYVNTLFCRKQWRAAERSEERSVNWRGMQDLVR